MLEVLLVIVIVVVIAVFRIGVYRVVVHLQITVNCKVSHTYRLGIHVFYHTSLWVGGLTEN